MCLCIDIFSIITHMISSVTHRVKIRGHDGRKTVTTKSIRARGTSNFFFFLVEFEAKRSKKTRHTVRDTSGGRVSCGK